MPQYPALPSDGQLLVVERPIILESKFDFWGLLACAECIQCVGDVALSEAISLGSIRLLTGLRQADEAQ
jgi:hypothetical protein